MREWHEYPGEWKIKERERERERERGTLLEPSPELVKQNMVAASCNHGDWAIEFTEIQPWSLRERSDGREKGRGSFFEI